MDWVFHGFVYIKPPNKKIKRCNNNKKRVGPKTYPKSPEPNLTRFNRVPHKTVRAMLQVVAPDFPLDYCPDCNLYEKHCYCMYD